MNILTYSPQDFITEICKEEGIQLSILSEGYICRLTKDGHTRHVMWSNWDINPATADRIACDKAASYIVLSESNVPAIPHFIINHPHRRRGWTGAHGAWSQALALFEKYKKVVVKPNNGTNGNDVYLCTTVQELEGAVHAIFETCPAIAISPYFDIVTEYRVFYINGNCPLVYGKKPAEGNWQHNLNQGATAFLLEPTDPRIPEIKKIAQAAAQAININFATIDVTLAADGAYRVMEINSGVQARQLVAQHPEVQPVVKDIYKQAVLGMFGILQKSQNCS